MGLLLLIALGLLYLRHQLGEARQREALERVNAALIEALKAPRGTREAPLERAHEAANEAVRAGFFVADPYAAFVLHVVEELQRMEDAAPAQPPPDDSSEAMLWLLAEGELEAAAALGEGKLEAMSQDDLRRPQLEILLRLISELEALR